MLSICNSSETFGGISVAAATDPKLGAGSYFLLLIIEKKKIEEREKNKSHIKWSFFVKFIFFLNEW